MRSIIICALLAGVAAGAAPAAPTPMQILEKALSIHKNVKDYTATITLSTNIPGLELPTRSAKVYVKLPDKVYVESAGVFPVPRRAVLFGGISDDVRRGVTASLMGTKKVNGQTIYSLKLVPKPTDANRIAMPQSIAVWINGSRWTIEKVQVIMGSAVVGTAQFTWAKVGSYWMPTRIVASAPKEVIGTGQSGTLTMTMSNYQVNVGLTDEFFAQHQRRPTPRRHGHPHPQP